MNFIVNQPDELKMISANADNIIYNAGWIGTSAALEANASYNQTVASVGRYKASNYFRPSNNTISEWKYIEFVDLFRNLGRWNYDLTRLNNWGTGGEENRMSVVNSLITNNIDRTKFEASGTATITLSATTKALLTAEEISQIEAMGYTLA